MRVLIADDQKSVGTSLAELVRLCQHEVVEVVSSGLEAIHAYDRHRPDVVLMDFQMPKLNGATACRNIVAKYPCLRPGARQSRQLRRDGHSGKAGAARATLRRALRCRFTADLILQGGITNRPGVL